MLTTAQMDEVSRVLDVSRDAVLSADEKVRSLKGKGDEVLAISVAAVRVLYLMGALPGEQADQMTTDMLAVVFRNAGIPLEEANEFCATRNRLRHELAEIEAAVE